MDDGQTSSGRSRLAALAAAAVCLVPAYGHASAALSLDLVPFRAASCAELQNEYRATVEVNRAVLEEMRRTVGAPIYASMGLGLYTATPDPVPETPQEALEAYQHALRVVAEEKKCALSQPAGGLEAKAR